MADAFTLTLPIDAAYRSLAPVVAGRYAELSGGSTADGEVLAAALTAAIGRLAPKVTPDASMDMAFSPQAGGVQVDLVCGPHRESVTVEIPANRR